MAARAVANAFIDTWRRSFSCAVMSRFRRLVDIRATSALCYNVPTMILNEFIPVVLIGAFATFIFLVVIKGHVT
jgi:hypothetical protein